MKKSFALLCSLLWLGVSGCGSNSELSNGRFSNFDASSLTVATPRAIITGRFDPGAKTGGATIQVVSLAEKQVLATTSSDSLGNFSFAADGFPANFRIIARVGQTTEFAREVRGYDQLPLYVVINAPTSLVSAYLQTSGGSLEDAEKRVKSFLRFPADRSLEYGTEETFRSPFSHLAFYQKAAAAGGYGAFRDQIVGQLGSLPIQAVDPRSPGRFALKPSLLKAAIPALEPELQSLAASTAAGAAYTTLDGTTGTDFSPYQYFALICEGLPPGESAVFVPQTSSKVSARLLDSLLSTIDSQIIDDSWTHIADALGLNYGTTVMLQQVQQQLAEAVADLDHLAGQVNKAAIQTDYDTLSGPVARVYGSSNGTSSQGGSLNQFSVVNLTVLNNPNVPYSPGQAAATLISYVQSTNFSDAINQIQDVVNYDFFVDVTNEIYNTLMAVNNQSGYGNYPIRNQTTQSQALSAFNYYAQVQQAAAYSIAEDAHTMVSQATQLADSPASIMSSNFGVISSAASNVKGQKGYVPFELMSNDVIVDLQLGLMWYRYVGSPTDWDTANSNASALSVNLGNGVVYDDWRLADATDLRALQDRGRLCPVAQRDSSIQHDGSDSSYGNFGYAVAGLKNYGFDATSLEASDSGDGTYWEGAFILGPLTWGQLSNSNCNMNHASDSKFYGSDKKHTYPYFIVRTIGDTPVLINQQNIVDHDGYCPFRGGLVAQEFPMLGYPTSVSAPGVHNGVLGATIGWTIPIGGTFTMGLNSEASYALASASHTASIDSYHGGTSDFSGAYDLNEILQMTSSNTNVLDVGVTGKLLWHSTTGAPLSATVTATVRNAINSTLTNSAVISANPAPIKQLVKVQIFPRNRRYSVGNSGTSEYYFMLAYYDDNTVVDVSSQARWSTDGGSSGAYFNTQDPLVPDLLEIPHGAPTFANVTATFGGQSDTTAFEVLSN